VSGYTRQPERILMASWSDLLLPLFVAAVLLYLPGGLITAAARLPVRVAVAVAPPLSVAIIAGTGIIAPMVGLAWGPGPVAGVSVIAVLAALAVHHASTLLASRRARGHSAPNRSGTAPPERRRHPWCSQPLDPQL